MDVLCGRLLDQCYEGVEQWAYRNLWPMVEQAVEREVMGEPIGVVLERVGGPLRFPEDRNILIEIDAWVIKRRIFVFECILYRCDRKRIEPFGHLFIPMMQCRIEDAETRAAVPVPLSETFSGRLTELEGEAGRIIHRYRTEIRRLEPATWSCPVVYERVVTPELCEFTDMAAFMNHVGQIASEGRELVLQHLRSVDGAGYDALLRSLACPMKLLIVEIKNPLWLREPMAIQVRSCVSGDSFHFDFEIGSVRPKRLCERMLVSYGPALPR